MLLFFLLQFYFLISSWNSSDRFCNGVLSGSIDFQLRGCGFSTQCVPSFPSVLLYLSGALGHGQTAFTRLA